jgi:hypothetical protein
MLTNKECHLTTAADIYNRVKQEARKARGKCRKKSILPAISTMNYNAE